MSFQNDQWWEVLTVIRHDKNLRDSIFCDDAYFHDSLWNDVVKRLSKEGVSEYEVVIKILMSFKETVMTLGEKSRGLRLMNIPFTFTVGEEPFEQIIRVESDVYDEKRVLTFRTGYRDDQVTEQI